MPEATGAEVLGGRGTERRWRAGLVAYVLALVGIVGAAYLRLIPTESARIPLFDTLGHFGLIGTGALLLDRVWRHRVTRFSLPGGEIVLPSAALFVTALAAVEELVQTLSPARTFDPVDLAAGAAGALAFCWGPAFLRERRRRFRR